MSEKFANKTAPRPPRCAGCAQPMQLLRRTPRFDGLPDLYSFDCCTCDQWHVEEATPLRFRLQTRRPGYPRLRSGIDRPINRSP